MAANPAPQVPSLFSVEGGFSSIDPDAGGGEPDPPPTGGDVAGNIVSDGFESGDFSAPGNTGFQWGNKLSTSIVTMSEAGNPTVIHTASSPTYNELVGDSRDWTAFEGDNCLRFRYTAGSQSESEQRFSFGPLREVWMSFWVRVPTSYVHADGAGNNNKLWHMWMDAYSVDGDGSTIGMEMRPDGSGGSTFYCKVGEGRFNNSGGDQGGYQPWITVPEDRGRWSKIVVRAVCESSEDAGDGSLEVWQKWSGDEFYTKPFDLQNYVVRVPALGPEGFAVGYIMGYANSGYSQDTEWLVDGFNLSTESLL